MNNTSLGCFTFINVCKRFCFTSTLQPQRFRETIGSILSLGGNRGRSSSRALEHDIAKSDECSSTSSSEEAGTSKVRSFLRRSASVCSLSERFSHRRDLLVQESRHNPYIGYFLRHDCPGGFSLPSKSTTLRPRRGSARFIRPVPAIKTSSMASATTTATPSPSSTTTPRMKKGVTFSKTIRRSSLVMTDWEIHRTHRRPISTFFNFILNSAANTAVSHGVIL